MQVQELIEDCDTVVIEEAETETKNDDLEESLSDMIENDIIENDTVEWSDLKFEIVI